MDNIGKEGVLLVLWLVLNLLAFFVMLLDKAQSRKAGAERFPEGILFFLATAFAGTGILVGMLALNHKTRKWYFLLGIPLAVIQNVLAAFWIYAYLGAV